jgi:hypothetical protein
MSMPTYVISSMYAEISWQLVYDFQNVISGYGGYQVCIQGGAMNCGLKCFFFKYRPSSLIEAVGSPEKG